MQSSLLVITNQCGNPCQMRNNMNLSPWAVLYFHVLCQTLGICRDASASADFKRAVVVLPKVAGGGINGNITFDEDISSSAVSVSFQLNGMNASVRYKVSVYPLAEKPLAAAVPSNDLAVVGFNANHLYLLFNGTMPQGIVAPIDLGWRTDYIDIDASRFGHALEGQCQLDHTGTDRRCKQIQFEPLAIARGT